MEEVYSDWVEHKRTLTSSPNSTSSSHVHRIDVLKPDINYSSRNATIVDNFLFWLEQYFNIVIVWDEAQR